MKKFITCIALMLVCGVAYSAPISVDPFVSPDDVTINHLEDFRTKTVNAINNADGNLILSKTVSPDKLTDGANPEVRWNEAFNNWVYTGLTVPTTSGTLSSTTTSGTAYIEGVRVEKDATANAYSASKWTWVDINRAGVYKYTETAIDGGEPALDSESLRLARVSTDGSEVGNVLDMRFTSISLDARSEDFTRVGFELTATTPDTVDVNPGVVYVGAVRVNKTTATQLKLGTAGDWATGGSQRATSTMGYVVVNSSGSVKLSTTAPTLQSASGITAGKKRYSVISANNWRVVGWFYMDAVGSGNVQHEYSNFPDGAFSMSKVTGDTNVTTASTSYVNMADMDSHFYSAGGKVRLTFSAPVENDGANKNYVGLVVDGELKHFQQAGEDNGSWSDVIVLDWVEVLGEGEHTAQVQWKAAAGNAWQQGVDDGSRVLIMQEGE